MSKKIEFIAEGKQVLNYFDFPKPAKLTNPEWYKKTPRFMFNDKKPGIVNKNNSFIPNTTYKACMPFRDAMSAGYTWSLPVDIEIRNVGGEFSIKYQTLDNLIDVHILEQAPTLPNAFGSISSLLFKFNCNFRIKTPKGYSILFTHPLNRNDLPFRTMSGIVETDKYDLPINFPFQLSTSLEENDFIILPANTPIIQFIPIKRESWKHQKSINEKDNFNVRIFNLRKTISNSYRNQFWIKKEYN
jgi:hypothetical protein